jgi:hypothetical protein
MEATNTGAAEKRYDQLAISRQPFLDRGRDIAAKVIPSLFPPEGHDGTSRLRQPYQGVVARGVNNLAAKLLLALLPPNTPFFRFVIDPRIAAQEQSDMLEAVQQALVDREKFVMQEIETGTLRVGAYEALKQLLVIGNVLLYFSKQGVMRSMRLDKYVVHRDPEGNVLEIVTKEMIPEEQVPEPIRKKEPTEAPAGQRVDKTVAVYTWIRRAAEGKPWVVHQEIRGQVVPKSGGTYPSDKLPWIPLRWSRIDGEAYGRSLCEDSYGDIRSLEALSKAVVQGSAAAAKILFMVNPGGVTRKKDLESAENLAVITGLADDVSVLRIEKLSDFNVAKTAIDTITERMEASFLLNASVQRAGERVTAEEIRFMASELEDALGGVYSLLSQELQLPLVKVLLSRMESAGKIQPLPKDVIAPQIVTGLDALGRSHDLNKLHLGLRTIAETLGPEAAHLWINPETVISRIFVALGVDQKALVKTAEEVQETLQQQQQQQMMEKLGPAGIKAASEQVTNATAAA